MTEINDSSTRNQDEVFEGGVVGVEIPRGVDFLPRPNGADTDKKLYTAWRDHMIRGFEQNNLMFQRILNAMMRPYWITVGMYVALFVVGLGGFIVAAYFAIARNLEFSLIFGGLSVGSFLAFFISRPLRALEQNLLFITWLGVIYNTYWSRLTYTNQIETVQEDLDAIEDNAIAEINKLLNKQEKLRRHLPILEPDES